MGCENPLRYGRLRKLRLRCVTILPKQVMFYKDSFYASTPRYSTQGSAAPIVSVDFLVYCPSEGRLCEENYNAWRTAVGHWLCWGVKRPRFPALVATKSTQRVCLGPYLILSLWRLKLLCSSCYANVGYKAKHVLCY